MEQIDFDLVIFVAIFENRQLLSQKLPFLWRKPAFRSFYGAGERKGPPGAGSKAHILV